MTHWTTLNSDTGTTFVDGMQFDASNIGGKEAAISLIDQPPATDHYFPIAVSLAPENPSLKAKVAFGFYIEYF